MVRLLGALVVTFLAVGCGVSEQSGSGSPSTGVVETSPVPSDETEEPPAGPPRIVLTSSAGTQKAVSGSFCVDDPSHGVGTCGDAGIVYPVELTVAAPGEEVSVALEGALVVRGAGCYSESGESACIGSVRVRPLGCERRTAATIPLRPRQETRFIIDVPPGAYELDVFAYFAGTDGLSGDVSGTLGLLVDEARAREVVPVSPADRVCAQG